MTFTAGVLILLILLGMGLSIRLKTLTPGAAALGGLLSALLYAGCGYRAVVLLAVFFIIGVGVTSWKSKAKQKAGLAEPSKGRRTIGQVMANAGMAAILGTIAWISPAFEHKAFFLVAACFASATADTVSSELGTIYGRQFYHILSFKRAPRGLNGAVSLQGSLWGLVGSVLIALVFYYFESTVWRTGIIVIAGNAGNLADSVLGALFENRGQLNNNTVNFLNTAFAAVVAALLLALGA